MQTSAPKILGIVCCVTWLALTADVRSTALPAAPAPELHAKVLRTFGLGRADSSAAAINPPDGLAFTKGGLLIATDAMNHRIQIFNPRTGEHLGHAGESGLITGLIVNVISLPNDGLLISDETASQAYYFENVGGSQVRYRPAGPPLFKGEGFRRLNGLACDSKRRIYVVDGPMGEVRRYLPNFKPDPGWKFHGRRPDNESLLKQSEGIAIDEKIDTLFLTSEQEGMIHTFRLETGEWLGKTIGRRTDVLTGKSLGQSVFQRSVEGLAIIGDYLLAVDEGQMDPSANWPGHLLIFHLRSPALYETGADECRSRMESGVVDGLVGWLGSYRSPDGVAVFPGDGDSEAMIAVADQGAYQVLVYLWKDVLAVLQKASKAK